MIVVGRYREAYPGSKWAPFIDVDVQSATGQWTTITFLIDPGADATYLPAPYMQTLHLDPSKLPGRNDTSGVGSSNLNTLQFLTQVRFVGEAEEQIDTVAIGVFSDPAVLDFPLLGRDLLSLFLLICDEEQNLVYLLDGDDRQRMLEFVLQLSITSP